MLRFIVAGVVVAVAACGGENARSSSRHTIQGTMDLVESRALLDRYLSDLADANGDYSKVDCSSGLPGTGYSDIHAGVQVVVADESGTTIGTTSLGAGRLSYQGPIDARTSCQFPFTVSVPKAAFYKVSVGRRGDITNSFEEMVAQEWRVELAVGEDT